MKFLEKLSLATRRTGASLCVGIDTDIKKLPASVLSASNPVLAFNLGLIEATKEFAAAYKINIAYYENYGAKGLEALQGTLDAIHSDILTIADVKRGDIGNTSEQYASAYQELYAFDSVTLNPLMGFDGVEPFLRRDDRGVFFLGLTSNPGARDFEYLELKNGKRLYEQITDTVAQWNQAKQNCGLVVGATKPEELRALRERAPELPFLIPGIGAQGGSLQDVLRANGDGPALINVSRGIARASIGDDYAEAASRAASSYVSQMRQLATKS